MREIKYDRFAPAMLIFGAKANLSALQEPEQLFWKGEGPNPVCTMRSSWSERAHFVGFKMGMASVNHGHMDVGSFIYERDGIRWALDLGSENYNTLEQNMPDLWKGGQASGRWNVYRYNVRNHNTLCFDGERQIVSGKAELGKWSDQRGHMYATSDITPAYAGQVRKAERAVSLIDGEYVVVEDKISTLDRPTQLTWTLMTEAEGTKIDDNLVRLDARGQKLFLRVEGVSSPEWTFSDAKPQTSYENQNKGISCVRFSLNIPADTTISIRVFLTGDGRRRSYQALL